MASSSPGQDVGETPKTSLSPSFLGMQKLFEALDIVHLPGDILASLDEAFPWPTDTYIYDIHLLMTIQGRTSTRSQAGACPRAFVFPFCLFGDLICRHTTLPVG